MPAPKKSKSAEKFSNENLALLGIDYFNKKDAIKELESQCKEIRKPLEACIASSGKELPNGSRIVVLPHADVDVHLKQTLRVGKVVLVDAMDYLRKKGFDECIESVPTLREDVVERLHREGKISDEDLTHIYGAKSNYAFSVDLKNRMPDAPE